MNDIEKRAAAFAADLTEGCEIIDDPLARGYVVERIDDGSAHVKSNGVVIEFRACGIRTLEIKITAVNFAEEDKPHVPE